MFCVGLNHFVTPRYQSQVDEMPHLTPPSEEHMERNPTAVTDTVARESLSQVRVPSDVADSPSMKLCLIGAHGIGGAIIALPPTLAGSGFVCGVAPLLWVPTLLMTLSSSVFVCEKFCLEEPPHN